MYKIDILDYFKKAVQLDFLSNFQWFIDMLSYIIEDTYEDEFIKIDNGSFYVKLKDNETDELYLITDNYKDPVLDIKAKITIEKDFLPNVSKSIETTVGRVIANYILLARVFGNKIDYINQPFTVSDIEDGYIAKYLEFDKNDPRNITIDEYTKFVDSVSYLTRLNRLIVHAGTPKLLTRPEGIEEYRKKLIEEAKKKYGEDALERLDVVGEIDKKLEEYEKEYLKDDPTLAPKISGKTMGALKKMYASYGHGGDFFYNDGKAHYIDKSLEEGWRDDQKDITIIYNDIRMASYKRGAETQKGGYTAKQGLRATADLKIIKGDCGSKVGLDITLDKNNYKSYIGRYMLQNGKPVLLTEENIKPLIGKTITIRSPMFCHTEINFCSTCMGENVKNYENGISIMVINMAGVILNSSMKAMHDQSIKLAKLDMNDLI